MVENTGTGYQISDTNTGYETSVRQVLPWGGILHFELSRIKNDIAQIKTKPSPITSW